MNTFQLLNDISGTQDVTRQVQVSHNHHLIISCNCFLLPHRVSLTERNFVTILSCFALITGGEITNPLFEDSRAYNTDEALKLSVKDNTAESESRARATAELNLYLQRHRLAVTDDSSMPWDGDCWFHCLSWLHGQDRTTANAKRYRTEIVDFLIANKSDYIHFCVDGKGNIISEQAYIASCEYLRRRGTYNTATTVVADMVPMAIAAKYNVHIVIYNPPYSQPTSVGDAMAEKTLNVAKITTPSCEHIQGVVPLS